MAQECEKNKELTRCILVKVKKMIDEIPTGPDGGGDIPDVSGTVSGIVNNTPLQELGGVDKTINGVRIGGGNNNLEGNMVLGNGGLAIVTTGIYNMAVGYGVLASLTSGSNNTAIGAYSQYYNQDGAYNLSIGVSSLQNNVHGTQNVAIGDFALYNNIGTAGSQIFGHRSIAIGTSAMYANTTGNGIAIGNTSLRNQTTGQWNTAIGFQAGGGITTGNGNLIIASTGFVTVGGGITTGSNNMILAPNNGNTTGITTGSGNVVIGKVTGLPTNATNTITIADGSGNTSIIVDSNQNVRVKQKLDSFGTNSLDIGTDNSLGLGKIINIGETAGPGTTVNIAQDVNIDNLYNLGELYLKNIVTINATFSSGGNNIIIIATGALNYTIQPGFGIGATNAGRYIIIKNYGSVRTFTVGYIDNTGVTTTVIPNNTTLHLIYDGTNWQQI